MRLRRNARNDYLTARQRAALDYIVQHPRCLVKQLAAELGGVSLGSASGHAAALRLKGLIQQRGLVATAAGIALLAPPPERPLFFEGQ